MPYIITTTPVDGATYLDTIGLPSAADDLRDGELYETVAGRLRAIGEDDAADGLLAAIPTTRRAVATLDEARDYAAQLVEASAPAQLDGSANDERLWHARDDQALSLPESGGTVALPDGMVIEVEPIDWHEIGNALEASGINVDTFDGSAIDAYNAILAA